MDKVPHKAILHINCEIHPVLSTNELSGKPLTKKELEEFGLNFPTTVCVSGFDKTDCIQKLIEKLGDLCKAK